MPQNELLLQKLNDMKFDTVAPEEREAMHTMLQTILESKNPDEFRSAVGNNFKELFGEDAELPPAFDDNFLLAHVSGHPELDMIPLIQAAAAAYIRIGLPLLYPEELEELNNDKAQALFFFKDHLDSPLGRGESEFTKQGEEAEILPKARIDEIHQEARRLLSLRSSLHISLEEISKLQAKMNKTIQDVINLPADAPMSNKAILSLAQQLSTIKDKLNSFLILGMLSAADKAKIEEIKGTIAEMDAHFSKGGDLEEKLGTAYRKIVKENQGNVPDEPLILRQLNMVRLDEGRDRITDSALKNLIRKANDDLGVCKAICELVAADNDSLEAVQAQVQKLENIRNELETRQSFRLIKEIYEEIEGFNQPHSKPGSDDDIEARNRNFKAAEIKLSLMKSALEEVERKTGQDVMFANLRQEALLNYNLAKMAIRQLQGNVLANARLEMPSNEPHLASFVKFSDCLVKDRDKGNLPNAPASPEPAAPGVQVGNRNDDKAYHSLKYKGILMKPGDTIVSTAVFTDGKQGRVEKDHNMRVIDKTDPNAGLSDEQKAFVALKIARMKLDNYKLSDGPIMITGKDSDQANRVCAALLNINKNLKIESYVAGCEVPQKGRWGGTDKINQFINDHLVVKAKLPPAVLEKERLSAGKFFTAAQDKRDKLNAMKDTGKSAEKALKVGQIDELDEKGKKIIRKDEASPPDDLPNNAMKL